MSPKTPAHRPMTAVGTYGDGTGLEVMDATLRVLTAAEAPLAYHLWHPARDLGQRP